MFEDVVKNLNFDVKIRAEASISALKYVDLMISDFKERKAINKADVLLDVFGLLQGLFVGIDSLYQLSISITKFKYHININENEVLRQLKFVRNDVVGHPTNRSYTDGSYGFSFILDEEIKKDNLSYITYVIKNEEITKRQTNINFNEVIKAYEDAKVEVIQNIEDFFERKPSKQDISGFLVTLFEKVQEDSLNLKDLEELTKFIREDQNLRKNSVNRFNYHVKLLTRLITIKSNKYPEVIKYIKLKEIIKIYSMYLDLNDKKARLPIIDKPLILQKIRDDLNKNISLAEFNTILNDPKNIVSETKLKNLVSDVKLNESKDYLKWFMEAQTNDESYLIAKTIKEILN